jgi:hypothetical protein
MVEVTKPPIIALAIGELNSDPAPKPKTKGNIPMNR